MLTKQYKNKLKTVCRILFPEYKDIHISRYTGNVIMRKHKTWLFNRLQPKIKINYPELMHYRLPLQLALFKYNNSSFISAVQEDLVRCEFNGTSPLDYIYNEISNIKYADLYKETNIQDRVFTEEHIEQFETFSPEEEQMWDTMVSSYFLKKSPRRQLLRSEDFRLAVFYGILLIIVTYALLLHLIPR